MRARTHKRSRGFVHKPIGGMAVLLSIWLSSLASASDVYDIEGFISAEFGGRPFLAGEIGSGRMRIKSYQYFDEANVIVYALGFDAERSPPAPEAEMPLLLREYATSQANTVGSSLSSYVTENIGSQLVAFYTIRYVVQGITWTKVTMLTIVHGRNITWSIQSADGYSSVDGEAVFKQSFPKLRVCGHSLYSTKIPICDPQ